MNDDVGLERLDQARKAFKKARRLHLQQFDGAEAEGRSALATARSAMDWLEDTIHFDEAHDLLHEIGRFVRSTWGCSVGQAGKGYWRDCPADLAHIRYGLSPGMVIGASECSICHQDPETCEHIKGREYDGETCYRIITEIREILEVSFVSRPAQPDARIERVNVSTDRLQAHLGPQWHPGMRVSCDKCLSPCSGFSAE